MEELRACVEADPSYPEILFAYPASLEDGSEFFSEFWPEARAVSDPEGRIFADFDVSPASLRQIFGAGVWVRAMQARRKGSRVRWPIGNPWLLPGVFLVQGNRIVWSWRYKHIGDQPDFEEIVKLVPS